MPRLRIQEGPGHGELLDLVGSRISVGRAADNDISLDDRTVSRYHAMFSERKGQWYVNDLGSRNRTMVNGECVVAARIRHMDEIHVGNVVFSFLKEADQAPMASSQLSQVEAPERDITQTIRLTHVPRPSGGRVELCGQSDLLGRRMGYLIELAHGFDSARTVEELLGEVSRCMCGAMRAERVIPIIVEADSEPRAYVAERGAFTPNLDALGIDVGLLERARDEGPTAAIVTGAESMAVACSPISIGDRFLGWLYCERESDGGAFALSALRFLFCAGVGTALTLEFTRFASRMVSRAQDLSRQLERRYDMVGESDAMCRVYRFIRKAAPTEAAVLIVGESGVGKELVAHALHRHSLRCDGPLEVVNCAAMPSTLIESELFGHVRGAFTGAVRDKPGRFELADGGTLFLDEIAELSTECQSKLLRVLEECKVRRVGDTHDRDVDVRIISATNRDPAAAIADGRLRKDLFYRVDRLRLSVPSLRERDGDVRLLAGYFLRKFAAQCGRPIAGFTEEAEELLSSYHWPGNVRELQNVVERMVIMGDGALLGAELVPENVRGAAMDAADSDLPSLSEVEQAHIVRTLRQTGGNKTRAAEMLGIDRSTLYAKLRRYDTDG